MLEGGISKEDGLTVDGINIGDYDNGEQANVIYTVRAKNGLEGETTRAITWAKVSVSDINMTNQDNADIYITK